MMNIAIDISPLKKGNFLQHRVRGTGFYLENLKKSLFKYYPDNNYHFFASGEKIDQHIDLTHYPYFEPFFLTLPFKKYSKSVVTVHDLTPLVFPQKFLRGIKGELKWNIQKILLKRMDLIIADSECSKRDIEKHAGIKGDKIDVVYLSAGEEFKVVQDSKLKIHNLRDKYSLPEKFLLYVGDITWNKNVPGILRSVKKTGLNLVIVGKAILEKNFDKNNPWNQDLVEAQKMIEENKEVSCLGFVPTEDLVYLYNMATALIMPSFYEGFGLPILEAMNCGCPVITAKEGSIPEIAGEAAFYVDAYNTENITNGINEVVSNKKLKIDLSQKGLIQAKGFSWEKTAKQMINVYKKVLEKG